MGKARRNPVGLDWNRSHPDELNGFLYVCIEIDVCTCIHVYAYRFLSSGFET